MLAIERFVEYLEEYSVVFEESSDDMLNMMKKIINIHPRVNLNAQDNDGKTALMLFIEKCYSENISLIEMLIKSGVDLDIQDNDGKTALMLAITNCPTHYGEEIIKLLVKSGVNLNLKCDNGSTALSMILLENHIYSIGNILIILLEGGADVNIQDNNNNTPLMLLIKHWSSCDLSYIKILLENGALIKNTNGNTALMLAAKKSVKIFDILSKSKNPIFSIKNNSGKTALDMIQ